MTLLYKFLSIKRLDYLNSELLRFTQPGALNDPYECIPSLNREDFAIFEKNIEAKLHAEFEFDRAAMTKWQRTKHKKAESKAMRESRRKTQRDPDFLIRLWLEKHKKNADDLVGIFSLSQCWNSAAM